MQRIIYTKFSNERDDRYSIRTDICEDEQGNRCVRKSALETAGRNHVKQMYSHYCSLSRQYEDTELVMNRCNLKDGYAEFEYITGGTLEQQLDELLLDEKYDAFEKLAAEYLEKIRISAYTIPFIKTEEFCGIFGDAVLEGEVSLPFSDIDMIFSNVIIEREKWVLIDYEWTYDFPVPLNYIIYRILSCYLNLKPIRKKICEKHGLLKIDFTEEQLESYHAMEQNFIRYISGGKKSIAQSYRDMENVCLTGKSVVELGTQCAQRRYQIYSDLGKGFSEEHVQSGYELESYHRKHLCIPQVEQCIAVRFDPSDRPGILYLNKLKNEMGSEIVFDTNGTKISNQVVLFQEEDPWIRFDMNGTAEVEYMFHEVEKAYAEYLQQILVDAKEEKQQQQKSYEKLAGRLETSRKKELELQNIQGQKETELQAAYEGLEYMRGAIDDIQNSFSWKLTAPIRKVNHWIHAGKEK